MKEIIKNIVFKIFSRFILKRGNKSSIYITFDDGPHPENTPVILSILKEYSVKATFFMTGKEMEKYPDVVKSVFADGHSIGYHSYSHRSYKKISIFTAINELTLGRSLANDLGIKLTLFRPPYGDLTPLAFTYLSLTGWKTIMWSLDSRDSFDGKEKVLELIDAKNIKGGEILLFHDDYTLTTGLLPEILEMYKNKQLHCDAL